MVEVGFFSVLQISEKTSRLAKCIGTHTWACTSQSYQACHILFLSPAYGLWTPVTYWQHMVVMGKVLDTGISFVLLQLHETILDSLSSILYLKQFYMFKIITLKKKKKKNKAKTIFLWNSTKVYI